jgi:hypothetical protein
MKSRFRFGLASLCLSVLMGVVSNQVVAAQFQQQEVEQSRYIAMAMPLASGHYKLLVVNQIRDTRPCWSESGGNPTRIEPLLVTFDFTNICGRSTDSNGYSIRVQNEELALRYSLMLEQRGNELALIGRLNGDSAAPPMVVGRTRGMTEGFMKIYLEPGWRFTRRTFSGRTLGHIYFTHDSMQAAVSGSTQPTSAAPAPQPAPGMPATGAPVSIPSRATSSTAGTPTRLPAPPASPRAPKVTGTGAPVGTVTPEITLDAPTPAVAPVTETPVTQPAAPVRISVPRPVSPR